VGHGVTLDYEGGTDMLGGSVRVDSRPGTGSQGRGEGASRRTANVLWPREPLVEDGDEAAIDTSLIPPGTQYGATCSNTGQRKPPKHQGFVTPGKALQRLMDHS
jgi:hypothetical protein